MDSVFRVYNVDAQTETYLLKQWGGFSKDRLTVWIEWLVRNNDQYDQDNLRWSGKALMNSVSPILWRDVERTVGLDASGPVIFKCILDKVQVVSASAVRSMVESLKKLSLAKEPGQDVQTFCAKIKDISCRIEGSGQAPVDLGSLVASRFLECDALPFKLKAIEFHDALDLDPNSHAIDAILEGLETKYLSLHTQDLWSPCPKQEVC